MQSIPLKQIRPSATNPSGRYDNLNELIASVRVHGVLQPVIVRKRIGPVAALSEPFELVCGHRRVAAAMEAGLGEIPAIVRELTDSEALEIQIVENLQREGVHPLDEAQGYELLRARHKLDAARIAERVGRSVPYVYDRLRLLSLHAEAAKAFRSGAISPAHAIVLARLKPADQKRALDPDHGGVFTEELTLWDPNEGRLPNGRGDRSLKAKSVRELQGWIDQHVKLDLAAKDLPELFPDLATAASQAKEKAERLVSITHTAYIHADARDDEKVIGPRSWHRADGRDKSKACELSSLGVFVVGPHRGETLRVCVDKLCPVHFPVKKSRGRGVTWTANAKGEAAKVKLAQDRQKAHREREDALDKTWDAALPEIRKALSAAIPSGSQIASGPIGEQLGTRFRRYGFDKIAGLFPLQKSPEGLVRWLTFMDLAGELEGWGARSEFPKLAEKLKLDVQKILAPFHQRLELEKKQAAAKEAKQAEAKKTPAKKKSKKTASRKKASGR